MFLEKIRENTNIHNSFEIAQKNVPFFNFWFRPFRCYHILVST